MSKQITHVVKVVDGRPLNGSGIGVYSRKELKQVLKATAEAGIPAHVRKVKRSER